MEKLIACPYKRPNALSRFPWAGGGTSQLAQWGKLFSSSTEVLKSPQRRKRGLHDSKIIQLSNAVLEKTLPGSDPRHMKPFAKDVTAMVNEITSVLLKELQEKTFPFFGHSFGSYISFAVALHLKENDGLEQIHLFISGAHAPHSEAFLHMRSLPVQDTEDEDILKYVQTLGGTSFELLQDEDMKKHLILSMRETARVLQTLSFEKAEGNIPFSCDITCFNGFEDIAPSYDVEGWHDLTRGDTSFYELPGGHFYLLEPSNETFLTKHLARCIEYAGL